MHIAQGFLSSVFLFFNTLFWCGCIYTLVLIRLLMPTRSLRDACSRAMVKIAENWIAGNGRALDAIQNIQWQIRGLEGLSYERCYLVSANHQSWVDIVVLQKALNRRIPFLRFFIKQELVYVPLLGLAWQALDFPRMKRHSKEYLEKHPEKRGEDLATTKRICEKLRGKHISVLNFLEGTRISPAKMAKQQSPYRHLLKPKTGGLAFVIESMGDQFHSLLDITIVYPQGAVTLWQLMSGQLRKVIVEIREIPIPREFLGKNYLEDAHYREQMQSWVLQMWQRKDQRIDELLNQPV